MRLLGARRGGGLDVHAAVPGAVGIAVHTVRCVGQPGRVHRDQVGDAPAQLRRHVGERLLLVGEQRVTALRRDVDGEQALALRYPERVPPDVHPGRGMEVVHPPMIQDPVLESLTGDLLPVR